MTYNLNQTDKNFLYKKYIKLGCTPKEAYNNVKTLNEQLKFNEAKLRAKKMIESEIREELRNQFYKKCQEIEGKF